MPKEIEEKKPTYEELLEEFRDLQKLSTALFKKYEESLYKSNQLEKRVAVLEEQIGIPG